MNELSAAWLLHGRPYKERSVIADFLVEGYGRVAMVVRGVRKARSKSGSLVQPFSRVLLGWRGRYELKTLTSIEPSRKVALSGRHLFSGLYLNELLIRSLLPGQDAEGVFSLYEMVLDKLAEGGSIEPVLRLFELELLSIAGYLPFLDRVCHSGDCVDPDHLYLFQPGEGLYRAIQPNDHHRSHYFSGVMLLTLAERDFSQKTHYAGFKRFTRLALQPLIGSKPLQSRALFRTTVREM